MDKLILNPTDTSQWHALVAEASAKRSTVLQEEIESYLVLTLMRFAVKPQLSSSIIALEYMESHQCIGQHRSNSLRDVGDKCLLFSGLFPGVAQRRRVNISYYVEIGKAAYCQLASSGEATLGDLFNNLSEEFVSMMDVLHAMRADTHGSILLVPSNPDQLVAEYSKFKPLRK